MTDSVQKLIDLMARANASVTEPPPLYASEDIVEEWVLVPRAHLKTILSWMGTIDEVDAVNMITAILADARLIGRKDQSSVDVPDPE